MEITWIWHLCYTLHGTGSYRVIRDAFVCLCVCDTSVLLNSTDSKHASADRGTACYLHLHGVLYCFWYIPSTMGLMLLHCRLLISMSFRKSIYLFKTYFRYLFTGEKFRHKNTSYGQEFSSVKLATQGTTYASSPSRETYDSRKPLSQQPRNISCMKRCLVLCADFRCLHGGV